MELTHRQLIGMVMLVCFACVILPIAVFFGERDRAPTPSPTLECTGGIEVTHMRYGMRVRCTGGAPEIMLNERFVADPVEPGLMVGTKIRRQ